MAQYSRRDFLRIGATIAAGLGLGRSAVPLLANGLQRVFAGQQRLLWLQGLSCTGCSISLLNSDEPGPLEIVTQLVSLVYHSNLSAAQGTQITELVQRCVKEGEYYLVLEGAVADMPEACELGGQPFNETLLAAVRGAKYVIAAGSCSAYGGIPAAEGNPTGAMSLGDFMKAKGIPVEKRLVNCAGCPVHPFSLVGTIAYLAGKGYPPVNPQWLTPDMMYKHSVHDDCPRFHYWQQEVFASKFGEEGCLFKLGCLGPLSHTNCPQRQWNGGVNWCIRAGAPCIACTSPDFARRRSFAFYRKGEEHHAVAYREQDRKGDKS
jgi:hydrogenase small subunit